MHFTLLELLAYAIAGAGLLLVGARIINVELRCLRFLLSNRALVLPTPSAEEDQAFGAVRASSTDHYKTIDALVRFLEEYPGGELAEEARLRLDLARRATRWGKKQSTREEKTRVRALWQRVFAPGLNPAKLFALELLSPCPSSLERLSWRAWCRIALEAKGPQREEARGRALRHPTVASLSVFDLHLLLRFLPEEESRVIQLDWARQALHRFSRRAEATGIIETLSHGTDITAANALYALGDFFLTRRDRPRAFAAFARFLSHPLASGDFAKNKLRQSVTPRCTQRPFMGRTLVRFTDTLSASFSLRSLKVEATPVEWLASPKAPMLRALAGDQVLGGALRLFALPLSRWSWALHSAPKPRGAFVHVISLEPRPVAGWPDCFGDEPMPRNEFHDRSMNTGLDAVLSLTEQSALLWVVDKHKSAPLADTEVLFFTQDTQDSQDSGGGEGCREHRVRTDEHGLATLSGVSFWQLGALVERPAEHGSRECIFLTHGAEIDTSAQHPSQERLYLWLARPLYRPGEVVRGKLIARTKDPKGASRRVPPGRRFKLLVCGPRQNQVADLSLTLSRFGAAAFTFTLPADAALGRYSFKQAGCYDPHIEGGFYVEEFVAPEFRASLSADEPPRWKAPTALNFEASYFFGGPVAMAHGTVEVRRRSWSYAESDDWPPLKTYTKSKRLSSLKFTTDAQGRAKLSLPWRGPIDPLRRHHGCDFELTATLRDASGKTCEATLTVSAMRATHLVDVKLPHRLRLPDEELPIELRWHHDGGDERSAQTLSLLFTRGFKRLRRSVEVFVGQSNQNIKHLLPPGRWQLRGALVGKGQPMRPPQELWVLGEGMEPPSCPRLLLSTDSARAGGQVRVAIVAPSARNPSAFLHCNSGAHLSGQASSMADHCAWMDLTVRPEDVPTLHAQAWLLDASGRLSPLSGSMALTAPEPELSQGSGLTLDFPGASAEPGAQTTLFARTEVQGECELVCRVVDESIFSIVPAGRDPRSFFEESPPRASSKPAWTAPYASAQRGLPRRYKPPAHAFDELMLGGAPPMCGPQPGAMFENVGAPMAVAMPVAMPMGAPSQAPLAPRINLGPGPAPPMRSRAAFSLPSINLGGSGPEVRAKAPPTPAPVMLRSDFSSEAAFFSEVPLVHAKRAELSVKLSDALTTWVASGLAISLNEQLATAEARIKTHKPLMVRLQAPRFVQELDTFTLSALLDSRQDRPLSVKSSLFAPSLTLLSASEFKLGVPAGGQSRVEVKALVTACAAREITVCAEARSEGDEPVGDAEERKLPYRPYGVEQRITLRGVLSSRALTLSLPEARRPEHTALALQLDRGPLDAVLAALAFLREYPYGCVEQTCSRLIPNLVWQEVEALGNAKREGLDYAYRSHGLSDVAVADGLRAIADMQCDNGGYGWWPRGSADVWMTAYVVFSLSLAKRPETEGTRRACRFLEDNLLRVSNPDDADAFAAFALAWSGRPPSEHTLDVLLSRWAELSLSEQAKLCWVLCAGEHSEAPERLKGLCRKHLPDAKRWLKAIAREDTRDPLWFRPAATEAIAFLVLALLKAPRGSHAQDLATFVSFLLMHRSGSRWHSTRDTALAVLALLSYESAVQTSDAELTLRVLVNGNDRAQLALCGLSDQAPGVLLRDDALCSGENKVELLTEPPPSPDSIAQPRYYSLALTYFSTEETIPASAQGIEVKRCYWLLNDKREGTRKLAPDERVVVGQRLRVELTLKASRLRRYIIIEDPKLAGCEPVATKSGPEVCQGRCAHVELRIDRTAIFLDAIGTDPQTLTYDIDARIAGSFCAMPARAETMYESECFGQSASFTLVIA